MNVGRVAGNTETTRVSPAPRPNSRGEPEQRERLGALGAYPRTPSRVRMPEPFAEFYRAIRGRDRDALRLVVLTPQTGSVPAAVDPAGALPHTSPVAGDRPPTDPQPATGGPQ